MTKLENETALALNHVGITVGDLNRSIALFECCFGFTLRARAGRPAGMAARLTGVAGAEVEIAFLDRPGLLVELLAFAQPETDAAIPSPHHPGAVHLAFELTDIATTLEQGRPFGLRLLGEVLSIPAGPNKGGRVAYAQQDTGVTLELIEAPQGSA